MELRTEKLFLLIFFIALFAVLAASTVHNIQDPWLILVLCGFFLMSFTFRNTSLQQEKAWFKYSTFIELFLVSVIFIVDTGMSTLFFFYILSANVALLYASWFSGAFAAASLIVMNVLDYLKSGAPDADTWLPVLMNRFYILVALYTMIRLLKLEIVQGKQLREALFQLKTKTKQMEDMYMKLKETTQQLEEMTAVKERNRIAREIHDTVGHTLTTVLIELEAGQRLMPLNPPEANEKLNLAKEQIRKGMNSIRESVRILREGHEINDLKQSLILLIEDTIKHTDVFINYEISVLSPVSPEVENLLYRALSEGLTNGIKHGASTAFVFKLKADHDKVTFFLQDNGKGSDYVLFGYGLTSMKEGVEEAGGTFLVHSAPSEGFTIEIGIPVHKGDKHEKDKDLAGG